MKHRCEPDECRQNGGNLVQLDNLLDECHVFECFEPYRLLVCLTYIQHRARACQMRSLELSELMPLLDVDCDLNYLYSDEPQQQYMDQDEVKPLQLVRLVNEA